MEDCETNDCRKEKRGCKGCYYEDKNIDKDIEKLDGFFNKGWACDLDEIYSIVMNIVRENDKLKEIVELADEKYCEMSKELETYKKIAEFLAGGLKFWSKSEMSEEELIDWARKEVEKDE